VTIAVPMTAIPAHVIPMRARDDTGGAEGDGRSQPRYTDGYREQHSSRGENARLQEPNVVPPRESAGDLVTDRGAEARGQIEREHPSRIEAGVGQEQRERRPEGGRAGEKNAPATKYVVIGGSSRAASRRGSIPRVDQ